MHIPYIVVFLSAINGVLPEQAADALGDGARQSSCRAALPPLLTPHHLSTKKTNHHLQGKFLQLLFKATLGLNFYTYLLNRL